MGYTSPEIQLGFGDGNGHLPMPDFAPEQNGDLTSDELTRMLLEPEQAEVDELTPQQLTKEGEEIDEVRGLESGEIDDFLVEHGTSLEPDETTETEGEQES